MSEEEFNGLKVTNKKLSWLGAALAIVLVLYTGIGDYQKRGFAIERLVERDLVRASEMTILSTKIESQNRLLTTEITNLKIAINRLIVQLEKKSGD